MEVRIQTMDSLADNDSFSAMPEAIRFFGAMHKSFSNVTQVAFLHAHQLDLLQVQVMQLTNGVC